MDKHRKIVDQKGMSLKNKMKYKIKIGLIIMGVLMVISSFIYGCFWVAKTTSYSFFYEDMVQQTITEMVKKEALK